jgi:acyl-CoA synthetase (AMP-forming)/AMP-acid ligase II
MERKDDILFIDDVLAPTGIEDDFKPLKCDNPAEKLLALLGSSGTSGTAKSVCISQWFPIEMLSGKTDLRLMHFGPIFWGLPFGLFLMMPLNRITRIVSRKLNCIENYIELVEKFKIQFLFVTPALLTKLLQSPLVHKFDLSSLKYFSSVGATTNPNLRKYFKEIFPDKILRSEYGLTEMVFTKPALENSAESYSIGEAKENYEVKIVDDDGNALEIGKSGEVCAKSMLFPFLGYYNNPEATKSVVNADGFFKTGDIGYFNDDGILHVIDRKKEIFKYFMHHVSKKNFPKIFDFLILSQINPTEIENVIQSMDGVESVAVVPIPNEETYNLACAVIIKRDELLTEKDVIDYVAQKLPHYKQLHGGVIFVNEFPMTPSGKVVKRLIQKMAEEKSTLQKE